MQYRLLFRIEHILEQDAAGFHCLNIWPHSIGYVLSIKKGLARRKTDTGSSLDAGSILASFCISAWRDAAFRLPPGRKSASRCYCENYLFTACFIQRILSGVFCGPLLVDGVDTQLAEGRRSVSRIIDNSKNLLPSDQPTQSHPSAPRPFLRLLLSYT